MQLIHTDGYFDREKWLAQGHLGIRFSGLCSRIPVTPALTSGLHHRLELGPQAFFFFYAHKWVQVKNFNNSILGSGLFSTKLPVGVTSSPLKEEISLYSIIRSKWLEKVIFPTLGLSSKMWQQVRGKTEDKCPTPWLGSWFLSKGGGSLWNEIAGRVTPHFPNDTGTVITLGK